MPALPPDLSINAWTGAEAASAHPASGALAWGMRPPPHRTPRLLAATPADPRDWRHPEIGWGLVLPEADDGWTPAQKAVAADAPEPIRRLRALRQDAPVFRYRTDLGTSELCRYYEDGRAQDIATVGTPTGTGPGLLPAYLLLAGNPVALPWRLQYALNVAPRQVGRLDLDEEGLDRYVRAVERDWEGAVAHPRRAVFWAADHGPKDITRLMRRAIAEPVHALLAADSDVGAGAVLHAGPDALSGGLARALADHRPGLVVTTSHGMTGPLDDPEAMAAQLGHLVGTDGVATAPEALLAGWEPDGAVWYAHACCSAGADAATAFAGLFDPDSGIGQTLGAVAASGARTAPLPRALLGAERPLRAFIGHVEPTFDWTLRSPRTGQVLTGSIQQSIYHGLYKPEPDPVGLAFRKTFEAVGGLLSVWDHARDERDAAETPEEQYAAREKALYFRLAGLDRQSLVILGDPAVCTPSVVA
jgi:hypothetical protein